jgi:hypothetical protein
MILYKHYLQYDSINNEENTETLIDPSKEVGLHVNTEISKYMCMFLFRHQNARQNHGINMANRCFENVSQFKYLEATNQSLIQEEIERRLNSGNACQH